MCLRNDRPKAAKPPKVEVNVTFFKNLSIFFFSGKAVLKEVGVVAARSRGPGSNPKKIEVQPSSWPAIQPAGRPVYRLAGYPAARPSSWPNYRPAKQIWC